MSARRRLTVLTKGDEETLKRIAAQERMFMRFSDEQRTQIGRLTRAGGFTTSSGSSTCDETIKLLAEAALCLFGLDPISEEAVYRISEVVFGHDNNGGSELSTCGKMLEAAGNDAREAANAWTLAQRAEERAAALKGRAA